MILLLGSLWIQHRRKLYVSFCLVDGHHFYVRRQDFQKIEKFHLLMLAKYLFNSIDFNK